ncbi:MAG: HEAT repeat domain-containing protein [Ekhidna sp.]|nr:HEAT repeat domain-containing protein [Ekhidna sp.]
MEKNYERAKELWQDRLSGNISEQEEKELQKFLDSNPAEAAALEQLEDTWRLFDEIERPSPSASMDARFEGMMAGYADQKQSSKTSILDWLILQISTSWQVGLASLLMGLSIGWWLLPTQGQQKDIAQLSSEIQTMKEMMMLTLIEQPKAQERIRAVNMAADLPTVDEKVIDALIFTLNEDKNVNVRLASLESLLRYSDQSEVRTALVDALKMQDSPILLVAIADALVALQEKSSIDTMEQLRQQTEDEIVRDKLDQSNQSLQKT